jgi:acyl carrier protein
VDSDALQAQVKEVMAGLFSVSPDEIGPDSSLESVEQWDSLNHVNLMMALEQAFGVRIDTEDALEMISFDGVCKTLERYLGGTP